MDFFCFQFLTAVMVKNYDNALKYCQMSKYQCYTILIGKSNVTEFKYR